MHVMLSPPAISAGSKGHDKLIKIVTTLYIFWKVYKLKMITKQSKRGDTFNQQMFSNFHLFVL